MYMRELSRIAIRPVRIAFDHWGTREPYEKSVRYAHDFGLDDLSNYMLYNFHDTPSDLFRRMRLNVDLNEELGIRIYSFPMRYQPTNLPDRSHVGEKWTKYQLRSMQIILQATQGIVSGEPASSSALSGKLKPNTRHCCGGHNTSSSTANGTTADLVARNSRPTRHPTPFRTATCRIDGIPVIKHAKSVSHRGQEHARPRPTQGSRAPHSTRKAR